MYKSLALLVAVAGWAFAEDWPGDGLFTAATTNDFYNGDAPFVLGDGMLLYTGPSAVLERELTFNPTNRMPSTINIQNADTELVVTGKFQQIQGPLIQTGEGTLVLTYPGYQEFGKDRAVAVDNSNIVWDVSTGSSTNCGYANWTLDRGRLVLGAPGQTNVIKGVAWVGSRTDASPRLDITGGVTRVTSSYFTIGRGTGTASNPQYPSMHVSNGAYVDMASLVLGYYNGKANVYSEPTLWIDGATVRVAGECFVGEQAPCKPSVVLTNGALFQVDHQAGSIYGLSVGRAVSPSNPALLDIGHSSTGMAYHLDVTTYATLKVHDDGTLFADSTTPGILKSGTCNGTIVFDGGKLMPRRNTVYSDWFSGSTNLLIGPSGMTVETSNGGYLASLARKLSGTTGGSITKTGSGFLAMRPVDVPVEVKAGSLQMVSATPYWTNDLSGTVTMDQDTALTVAGDQSLNGMTVDASAATNISFETQGLESQPGRWQFNDWARPREDGLLMLTENIPFTRGTAFLKQKVAVDESFTLTFDYLGYTISSVAADGMSAIWQNSTNGLGAVGGSSASLGYIGITNSFAVGLDCYINRIHFGEDGVFVKTVNLADSRPKLLNKAGFRNHVRIDYDAVAHHVTVTLTRSDLAMSLGYDYDVNMEERVGGKDAYFGFAAGCGGSYAQHCVSNVRFNPNGSARESARHGGRFTLGAGKTLTTTLNPSVVQRGFVLGELDYADGATLNVAENDSQAGAKLPELTLSNTNLWELMGSSHWVGNGAVAVSTNNYNKPGVISTKQAYPVSGSWTASFDYDIGKKTTPPADYIIFNIHNEASGSQQHTPYSGIAVMWRFYEGANRNTSLQLFLNGGRSPQSETNSIAPINLALNGPAKMSLAYDEPSSNLTVVTTQAGNTYTKVFTNIVLRSVLYGASSAKVGFAAFVGGYYSENIVSNFVFTSDTMSAGTAAEPQPAYAYLGFDRMNGSGTLVKTGAGALGLNGGIASNASLRLAEGGLVLRKEALEPVTFSPAGGWTLPRDGKWSANGGLQFGQYMQNYKGTAQLLHRVRVDGAWRVRFNLTMQSNTQADALTFFLHNDPRGPYCCGGQTMNGGFVGIQKGYAVRLYFYPGSDVFKSTIAVGNSSTLISAPLQSYLPVVLFGKTTAVEFTYDPAAKTLVSVMTQTGAGVTNTFTGVDIPAAVNDSLAYLGFGVGCGGFQTNPEFHDFTFEQLDHSDTLTNEVYAKSVTIVQAATVAMDTPATNAFFHLSDGVAMESGATLKAVSLAAASTLSVGTVTQGGAAGYDVDAGSILAIEKLVGGSSVTKSGAGILRFTGAAASAYSGPFILEGGTVQLDAPLLAETADMQVSTLNAPKLALNFSGKQRVHALYVDGVRMPGGRYTAANASWIAGTGALLVTWPAQGTVIMLKR